MSLNYLTSLPWDIFDTLINLAELLVILFPTFLAFMYCKTQSLSIWMLEITNDGATMIIHNKANKSVFITDIQFVSLETNDFENPVVAWNNAIIQLKPDAYQQIVINYKKKWHGAQSFKVVVKYNQEKKKVIKVTI